LGRLQSQLFSDRLEAFLAFGFLPGLVTQGLIPFRLLLLAASRRAASAPSCFCFSAA
jgi:hypothetical protein